MDEVERAFRAAHGAAVDTTEVSTAPAGAAGADHDPMRDDQLRLVFTCCHPVIRVEHQVALTLRRLTGALSALVSSLGRAPVRGTVTAVNQPFVPGRLARTIQAADP